jgi:nucleoside-diphosphate-sugar epimerase
MRVLVTGASGYLGPHVVTALVKNGHDVIAVSRRKHSIKFPDGVVAKVADVLSPGFAISELNAGIPDALVHLAWQDGFVHNSPSHLNLLSAHYTFLLGATKQVSRVTVLGTMHEVGYWEGPIEADTPTNPISLYGIAKDALRRALQASLPATTSLRWIRAYYITGDDLKSNSVFGKILLAVSRKEKSFPFTSGKSLYDFIDVDDLAKQISSVSTTDDFEGVINCCSGIPESLASRVERFIAENKLPISLEYGAFPDREYDSPGVWGEGKDIKDLMNRQEQ